MNKRLHAGHGIDETQTRIVEFNEFASEPGHPHGLPYEPVGDLHVKLDMKDFVWAVDDANVNANYSTVCQFRKFFVLNDLINPLIATLKPQSNRPSYSNTVIGTLAVGGRAVTFGTARRGLGRTAARSGPSSLYQM